MTRKQRVYDALKSRKWTPGYELTHPSVGGTEGLRRLRELREEGFDIKKRPMAGSAAYEYRLVGRKK